MERVAQFKVRVSWVCRWLVATVMLAGVLVSSAADLRWRWSNPGPHGNNIFDMAYGLGLTVQVCERGQLYTSEDLAFWEPRDSTVTNALRAVTFFGTRLLITGENGIVVYADSLADFKSLNLGTTDWLEGVAATANTIVAVGDNAAIYSSGDSTNWIRRTPPAEINSTWLRSVATDGSGFVAVGEQGTIITSPTGTTWTKRVSPVTNHLNRVAYFDGKYYVVGDNGVVLANNASGTTWTNVTGVGATNPLYAVAGTTGTNLVAGEAELRLLENGGGWSNELDTAKSYPAPRWSYFTAVREGSLFLAAGRSGVIVEGFKTNAGPMLWVMRNNSVRNWLWEVRRTPNFYVTVGDRATVMTSDDGVTWSLELVPDAVTNSILLGVSGTTNLLAAVGNQGTIIYSPNLLTNVSLTNVIVSSLSITNIIIPGVLTNILTTLVTNLVVTNYEANSIGALWLTAVSPTTNDLQGILVTTNLLIATGGTGTILTSTNGSNWTQQASPVSTLLSGIETFPGGFVAVGDQGTIIHSSNGTNWTQKTSNTTNWLFRVRYLGGQLIAVGQNGTVLTSTDGHTWTPRVSGTTRWLNDVTLVDGTYYAAGVLGTLLGSGDAVTWTNSPSITQKSLYSVTGMPGQLVAVGIEGAILRARTAPDLTPPSFKQFSHITPALLGGLPQNLFLLEGKVDQRFVIESSTNLLDWISGPALEFLDATGTLLYLENADAVPAQYFRGRLLP
jgi:hypothetical protein